jgi:preprotein translocase subunit SecB
LETTVNYAAVGRVSKHVDLKGVRLAAISAQCNPAVPGRVLVPKVDLECQLGDHDESNIEVVCDYTFVAHADDAQAIQSKLQYLVQYEVVSAGPLSEADLAEFARANGALHSWPFVREVLYGLTSRMGFPPYTLPVMHFKEKPKQVATPPPEPAAESPKPTEEEKS